MQYLAWNLYVYIERISTSSQNAGRKKKKEDLHFGLSWKSTFILAQTRLHVLGYGKYCWNQTSRFFSGRTRTNFWTRFAIEQAHRSEFRSIHKTKDRHHTKIRRKKFPRAPSGLNLNFKIPKCMVAHTKYTVQTRTSNGDCARTTHLHQNLRPVLDSAWNQGPRTC